MKSKYRFIALLDCYQNRICLFEWSRTLHFAILYGHVNHICLGRLINMLRDINTLAYTTICLFELSPFQQKKFSNMAVRLLDIRLYNIRPCNMTRLNGFAPPLFK